MKICLLTHTFPRFDGDIAAPFMHGVASGLVAAGNKVFVLAPYSIQFKPRNTSYKIITYKYIYPPLLHKIGYSETLVNDKKVKLIMYLLSPFMIIFGVVALLKLIKKEKIDLINAHWILPNGFVGAIASLLTGVPLVSTLPGSDVYMAGKNTIFAKMAKIALDVSKAITSNSSKLFEDLLKITDYSEKDVIIKKYYSIIYGVDPDQFKPDSSKSGILKQELGISENDRIVLSVGRLVEKKGFKYLIRAIAKLNNKMIKLVIVGSGDQKAELENLANELSIQKDVIFVGGVNYNELVNYYNLADIFVLSSVRDDMGNLDDQSVSVIEAMACGKPIITTNFPGYKLVVSDGKNGYLIPEKNTDSLAEKINYLFIHKAARVSMGKFSRDLTIKRFSWKAIGLQYTKLFESIIYA